MDIAKLNIRGYQPAKDNTSAQFLLCISSLGHRHKPCLKIISETETIETTDLFSFLGYESEPTMIFNLIYLPYKFIYIFIISPVPHSPSAVRLLFLQNHAFLVATLQHGMTEYTEWRKGGKQPQMLKDGMSPLILKKIK